MATKTQLRQGVKYFARKTLSEHFGPCVAVSLIAGVISTVAVSAASLFGTSLDAMVSAEALTTEELLTMLPGFLSTQGLSLLFGLLISPITVGSYAFFIELTRGRTMKISDLFVWFGDFYLVKRAIAATVWYTLLSLFWGVVFLALPIAALFALLVLDLPAELLMVFSLVTTLATLVCVLFAEVKILSYTPAMYLLGTDLSLGVMDTFRKSRELMRGHAWEFFVLQLSFLGWQLLASFTCGLSLLYVTPYMQLANCYFINHVMLTYHREHNIPMPDGMVASNATEAAERKDDGDGTTSF